MKFTCLRKECIEDPDDAYHYEEHLCFLCGRPFMPTPEMASKAQCPVCGWYRCPHCEGCKCSLAIHDQEWVENIFSTYCQDPLAMANIKVRDLNDTYNPRVKEGLGLQLRFCKRWAACHLGVVTDKHH